MTKRKRGRPPKAESGQFTALNAAEMARLSAEAKRRKKSLRETLLALLQMPSKKRKGMTTLESIGVELVLKAEDGNLRAIETLRDTIGEKPTEKNNQQVSGNIVVSWGGSVSKAFGDRSAALEAKSDGLTIDSTTTVSDNSGSKTIDVSASALL